LPVWQSNTHLLAFHHFYIPLFNVNVRISTFYYPTFSIKNTDMMQHLSLLITLLCFSLGLQGQVIYSEPAFPSSEEEVTIFFDATEGNGGLENCNCDVYLHTGVITDQSSGPSDWRYVPTTWGQANADWQLTPVPGESNLYSFTFSPSIRDYFGVPGAETIEQLAFVFRDAAGNQTGRADDGSDIFLDLYDESTGFAAVLQSPTDNALIVASGEEITVRVAVSEEATITVFDNGEELTSETTTLLNYPLIAGGEGTHIVSITVNNGETSQELDFAYAVPLDISNMDPPAGLEPGITLEDNKLKLSLFAPGKENIFVLGDFNDWRPNTDHQMIPSASGTWWIEIDGISDEETLAFQYLVDGEIRIADPYSKLVLDPSNDPFITEEVYPNLPAYPENASGIATLIQPDAFEYEWQVNDFVRPAQENLIIYECLVRDFLESHSYTDLIDTLPYLARMGYNALQLMPINEFEGNISWGYNPSYHMALDKYYGPMSEFKRLVDVCHAYGMAVIVDVVYNHGFGQSPLARLYWDGANNRPAADNPWYNPIPKHPFNVGNDFNHESPHTRDFVKRVMRYWLEETRVDGFRFDLSKGFTQVDNLNDVGAWGQYDPSRLVILKEYADVMWATTPGAYVIMEHFADWDEELEMAQYGQGMLMWNNMNHSYRNAVKGSSSSFDGTSYTHRGWDVPGLISYMESHDEERLMYTALTEGNSNGDYNVQELETALQRVEAASTIFYTIPGPKMSWQFGELGYDYSINYCIEDGSVQEGCRTGPKPIRWDYFDNSARNHLYETTRILASLKKHYEVFSTDDFNISAVGVGKVVQLFGDDFDVVAVANMGMEDELLQQVFPSTGEWHEVFTGETLNINTPNIVLPLEPGEYRLYTSEPIEIPVGTSDAPVRQSMDLQIFPNPGTGFIQYTYELSTAGVVNVEVLDLQGRVLQREWLGRQKAGWNGETLDLTLPAGTYALKVMTKDNVTTKLFVIK
jgi:1,4-alpha-glucan branching enzyme